MKSRPTIFVGPCGGGKTPTNGASIKNYHILSRIALYVPGVKVVDTEIWKHNPLVILRLLLCLLLHRKAKYIISANNLSALRFIRIVQLMCPNSQIVYWVIGGSIGKWIAEGRIKAEPYRKVSTIIVEGDSMKKQLKTFDIESKVMPNFKPIRQVVKREANAPRPLKFVFLSRITPLKGCDVIFEAVKKLNANGRADDYMVDFFGPIEAVYRDSFESQMAELPNVAYRGFLDLRDTANYDELARYDVMLFPTFWPGEGCPGVVIDAYMSGLPIIATDWNLNSDYIRDGVTGILIKAHDSNALAAAMSRYMSDGETLNSHKVNALSTARNYDISTILSVDNLRKCSVVD